MTKSVVEIRILSGWKARLFAIWSGQAFSLLGSQVVQFAIIWWLAKDSNSATVLTMASLAGLVPAVALGPVVGTLVDRWSRRIIMIASDVCTALLTLGLLVLFTSGEWRIGISIRCYSSGR